MYALAARWTLLYCTVLFNEYCLLLWILVLKLLFLHYYLILLLWSNEYTGYLPYQAARFMNRFPNYGSCYRGSMEASLRVIKHNYGHEEAHKKAINYIIPEQLLPKYAKYLFRIMVYQGSDFGSTGSNPANKSLSNSIIYSNTYALSVSVGSHIFTTRYHEYNNGSVDWVEILEGIELNLPG